MVYHLLLEISLKKREFPDHILIMIIKEGRSHIKEVKKIFRKEQESSAGIHVK